MKQSEFCNLGFSEQGPPQLVPEHFRINYGFVFNRREKKTLSFIFPVPEHLPSVAQKMKNPTHPEKFEHVWCFQCALQLCGGYRENTWISAKREDSPHFNISLEMQGLIQVGHLGSLASSLRKTGGTSWPHTITEGEFLNITVSFPWL